MLLDQPEFHHDLLWQQFGTYMTEVDIEAVDRDIFATVSVCHSFFGHLVGSGHAAETFCCLGGADICPVIQICLDPARTDSSGSDATVFQFYV